AFLNRQYLVHASPGYLVDDTAGPADFYQVYLCPLFEPEVEPEVALRQVAASAAHFVHLSKIAGHNFDPRSDAVTLTFDSNGLDQYRIISVAAVIAKQLWRSIKISYNDVDIAVVVEVAESDATAHPFFHQRCAALRSHFREGSVVAIPVKQLVLPVGAHLRVNVTVCYKEVNPPIIIIVKEFRSPS